MDVSNILSICLSPSRIETQFIGYHAHSLGGISIAFGEKNVRLNETNKCKHSDVRQKRKITLHI
jgi:hypothetical protein